MKLKNNFRKIYNKFMGVIDKIFRIVQIEKVRFQRKGLLNSIIAVILLFSIIYAATALGRSVWPEHIDNHNNFVFYGSFIIHTVCQAVYFLLYAPGYFGLSKSYEKYRINTKSSKPWERKNWPQVRQRTIKNLLVNFFIVYPMAVYLSTRMTISVRFEDFPSFWQVFVQLFFVYFVEDFFFYWGHRMFHTVPFLYKMHKVHHQYDSLYTLATEYFHPLDFLLANLLPSAMGFIFLGNRAHCFMFFFWQIWKVFISTEGHSGYEIPWSPMRICFFITGPSYHDHHHSMNVGNFAGSCYLWDVALGTSDQYFDKFIKNQ